MMAKRKATKRRQRREARIPDQTPDHARVPHSAGLPFAIPIYWTPEQAIAVFELVDELREQIWFLYQTDVQEMTRQQQKPAYLVPLKIDDDDLPF
jgi:hypothetical protein